MHRTHTQRLRRIWLVCLALALGAALVLGCTTTTTTPANNPLDGISEALRGAAVPSSIAFPLNIGTTWVYQGVVASAPLTASYSFTETVVDILRSAERPYTIVQVERHYALESCADDAAAWCAGIAPLEPTTYWYIIDGSTLYKQETLAAHRVPERGTVELLFPLTVERKWYLTAAMQAANPNFEVDSMLRQVVRKTTLRVPAGDFPDCYLLTDTIGGTKTETWFCAGIGFVLRAEEHHGTPASAHEWLVEYKLN